MEALIDPCFDHILELHARIGELLGKRRRDGTPVDSQDFPKSDEERTAWSEFTDPANFELLTQLFAAIPPINPQSRELWERALAECGRRRNERLRTVALQLIDLRVLEKRSGQVELTPFMRNLITELESVSARRDRAG